MPQYGAWDPALCTGHELVDAQHQALFALCSRLADQCAGRDGAADEAGFDQTLAELKAQARQHFEAEVVLLAGGLPGDPEDDIAEGEAFEFLMDEVATTSNFDRLELQRCLALWWLGHVRSVAIERAASGAWARTGQDRQRLIGRPFEGAQSRELCRRTYYRRGVGGCMTLVPKWRRWPKS